jgi:hypothetical protein
VPAGVYAITAHDPVTRFASFVATCRPGRVVNANPPWGLHELGLPNRARILAGWSVRGTQTQVTSLRVQKLPAGASVRLSCAGRGCRFGTRTFRPRAAAFDIRRTLGGRNLRLTAGDTLQVTVTANAFNGVVVRWVATSGHAPTRTTLCVALGYARPRRRCPRA